MRRFLLGLAALVLLGMAIAIWSVLIEPDRLVVRHRTLTLEKWPVDYPALRVALIADLHAGAPHIDMDKVREIVARTNAERPDMIFLLGDYVIQGVLGGRYIPPAPVADALAALEAPYGVYAVLGNHDWWDDGKAIDRRFEDAGITVLENEAVRVLWKGLPLWIAGLADDSTRRPDVADILSPVTDRAPMLVLSHDPAVFLEMDGRPVLTLASHTHGGQVHLPIYGALAIPGRAPRRWAYGHISEFGNDLFVTGGLGTSILPIRLNMPPEIVILSIATAAR